jgi:hypothetical protein
MDPNSNLITSASMGPATMTLVKLNGKNYGYWSQSVEVYLRGKGLYSHLESKQPLANSSQSLWNQADNQIISLMSNSIEPHIGSSCLYLPTIKQFGIISSICTLVLRTSLGFMRCVNNILDLSKVLKL